MTSVLHKPRFWLLTAAAVLVASTTFSLGQWQLRRASEKQGLQAAIEAQKSLSALDNRALLAIKNVADILHRPAVLTGSWRPEQTVYLDNRPMNGKSGFVVLTPLVLQGDAGSILVQRGWAPRNFAERSALPEVATPAGQVSVPGRIATPPSRLYEFESAESGRIRQNLDLRAFAGEIGQPLLPVTLLQTGPPTEGLIRDWAAPNFGVDKHYGYAFQWFAMCALMVFLYVWFQIFQPMRLKKPRLSP